jgi:hypothetical protein
MNWIPDQARNDENTIDGNLSNPDTVFLTTMTSNWVENSPTPQLNRGQNAL